MVLPIVTPAPVVAFHAEAFLDLFDNQCEFRHFQNYLTGLMVLENTSMANISNCILTSADKTNLSRFLVKPLGMNKRRMIAAFAICWTRRPPTVVQRRSRV